MQLTNNSTLPTVCAANSFPVIACTCLYDQNTLLSVIMLVYPLFLKGGFTALMVAAQEGHLSVVELLVSVGAQVNSQNNVSHISCSYVTYL